MNLTAFGATGGVGREVVTQALDAGHNVRAYVRNPAKLDLAHPNLTVITGELTDREAVQRAVGGADAVISALGPSLDRKATGMPLVDGTRTIVEAMQAEGVERYIGMATPSLRDPRDTRSLLGLVVPRMGRTFFPRAPRELLEMSQIVTGSSLNFTIARFTQPKDGERTGSTRSGFLGQDNSAPPSPAPTSPASCSPRRSTRVSPRRARDQQLTHHAGAAAATAFHASVRAGGHLPHPRGAPSFVHASERCRVRGVRRSRRTKNSSVDQTGLDYCSSMRCGSELGEDVLFVDSGQRR